MARSLLAGPVRRPRPSAASPGAASRGAANSGAANSGAASPGAAEVRALAAAARPWLAGAVSAGFGQAVLLVAQAGVLSSLLAEALYRGLTARAAVRDGLWLALLALGQAICGWAWEACAEAAARRARTATRRRALAAAIRLAASGQFPADECGGPPANPGVRGPGERSPGPGGMVTLLSAGVDELDPFVGRTLPRIVLALAVPMALLAWIGHLDLVSAGLAGAALTLAPLLAGLVGADTAVAVRTRLAGLERLGDRFAALVEGLPLLRAFGRAGDHERAVARSGEEVRAATLATLRIALLAGLVLELLAAVGTALVAVRLGLRLDAGQRILPKALAVLILTPEVFLPLRRMTADFHAGATGRAVLARIGRLTAEGRQPSSPRVAEQGPEAAGVVPGGVSRREQGPEPVGVVLEGLTLAAGSKDGPVLDRIDLRVPPGERLCVVGESGAGKSSLLRVLAGLVPPTKGRLFLEGPGLDGRRPAIGWVPQHPTVYAATIADNIALGRPGVDDRVAAAVLEAVQLGPWLRSMPEGLHTRLSGLDAPLSLGERRKLAVARSLAGPQPRLWLLDEPTAGLDRASVRRLVSDLSPIVDGATAIIATHDPAAMLLGHRMVELRQGRIRCSDGDRSRPGLGRVCPWGAR